MPMGGFVDALVVGMGSPFMAGMIIVLFFLLPMLIWRVNVEAMAIIMIPVLFIVNMVIPGMWLITLFFVGLGLGIVILRVWRK